MYRVLFFSFSPLLTWLPIISVVLSKAVNRSIDDTLGDSVTGQRPLFLPSTAGIWEDATCRKCALRPPIQDAYEQTWTAVTYKPHLGSTSISFTFTGTAIYVFFILSNALPPTYTATTAANFTLDGVFQTTYTHSPDPNGPAFQFNESALGFSKTGLENGTHNLLINTTGEDFIFVNFDYALYTFEEDNPPVLTSLSSSTTLASAAAGSSIASSTSKHSATHSSAIVGGAVGGLVALCTLTVAILLCYRRRGRKSEVRSTINTNSRWNLSSTMHRLAALLSPPPPSPSSPSPRDRSPLLDMSTAPEAELIHQQRHIVGSAHEGIEELQNQNEAGGQLEHSTSAGGNHDAREPSSLPSSQPEAALTPLPRLPSITIGPHRILHAESADVQHLRNLIREINEEMVFLRSQHDRDQALSLSDEPAPRYTTLSSLQPER